MTKIPLDDILESLYTLRIRESDQRKTVLEWYDIEIPQEISKPDYPKSKNDGEEKQRSETPIAKLLTPEMRELKQGQWLRIAGVSVCVERGQGECYPWQAKGPVFERRQV